MFSKRVVLKQALNIGKSLKTGSLTTETNHVRQSDIAQEIIMNTKSFLSIAMLVIGGTFSVGCLNTATFDAKAGNDPSDIGSNSYRIAGRSSTPEEMAATLSHNRQGELRAEAYKTAVDRGMMYPYGNVGPVGDYGNFYCQNGACMAPTPPPVMVAPQAPPATTPPATPSKPSAQKPVTREELDAVKAQAADAQKKADVSIGILKTVRTEKDKQKENAPAAQPVAPPAATPAQKPMSQQEIDEVNRRAEESRKRAEAASAASAPRP